MKALVTGATGFIGRPLVARLLERGDRVVCLVRNAAAAEPLRAQGAELRAGDLTDPKSYRRLVETVDTVYHLAGMIKAGRHSEFDRVNRGGAESLIEACAACAAPPVLLLVSSQAASGPSIQGAAADEADAPRPVSEYGRSKLAAEAAARRAADRLPITIVRPPVVLGPGDPNQIPLYRPILRFGLHWVPRPGSMRLSVVHVTDLVEGIIAAAERGTRLGTEPSPAAGVYFLAADEHPSYAELGQWIGEAVERKVRVVRLPRAGVWAAAAGLSLAGRLTGRPWILNVDKAREALAGDWICSTARAQAELGFAPRRSLRDRLGETVRWYREEGWI